MRRQGADWQVFDSGGRRKYLNASERAGFVAMAETLSPSRQALCLLLAYSGCRVSEALALQHDQIDVERSAVVFRTLKRRKLTYRVVPIPEDLCRLLTAMPHTDGGRLWTMHRTTAWRSVHAVAKRLQIDGPMACPRGLRHGFGIHAAASNVPPNLIQRWMGHASPFTTAIYLDAVGFEEREFASRMWR